MRALTKVILITAFIFICLPNSTLAQAPDTLWTKTFGGSEKDYYLSVKIIAGGDYVVTGGTNSFSSAESDIWIMRINNNGDSLWSKSLGMADHDFGYDIINTTTSEIVVFGNSDNALNKSDFRLIKLDVSGNIIWDNSYFSLTSDIAHSLIKTIDGGYLMVGRRGNPSSYDLLLIKCNANGDSIWTRVYGGSESDWGTDVVQAQDGSYIIVGTTKSFGAGQMDIWIVKTDSDGNLLWAKTLGESHGDYGHAIICTVDGNYVITGSVENDLWLIKINTVGDTLWTKKIGSNDSSESGLDVTQTNDGGFLIVGTTTSGYGSGDGYIVKTDENGNVNWANNIGDTESNVIKSLDIGNNNIILTGWTGSYALGDLDGWLIRLEADTTLVNIGENFSIILSDRLDQNYPNPFNPTTKIKYQIPGLNFVTLKVYDVLGNEVSTLVNEEKPVGTYEITWFAENLPSGIYFYRLQAGSFVETKKMVLMK